MSDDDTLDTEVLIGRPARGLPLGCGRCGWRGISCVYASVNSSQIGYDGMDLRYDLPFL